MQLELNFWKDRQLEIPFPSTPSLNQETLENLKTQLNSWTLSESEKRDIEAAIITEKERPISLNPYAP